VPARRRVISSSTLAIASSKSSAQPLLTKIQSACAHLPRIRSGYGVATVRLWGSFVSGYVLLVALLLALSVLHVVCARARWHEKNGTKQYLALRPHGARRCMRLASVLLIRMNSFIPYRKPHSIAYDSTHSTNRASSLYRIQRHNRDANRDQHSRRKWSCPAGQQVRPPSFVSCQIFQSSMSKESSMATSHCQARSKSLLRLLIE